MDDKEIIYLDPWDRREKSDRAWAAFNIYLDLGPVRTVGTAYEQYKKQFRPKKGTKKAFDPKKEQTPGHFKKWASEFKWRDRAFSYDNHLTKVEREATQKIIQLGAEKIGKKYVNLIRLQTINLERALQEGTLSQVTNHTFNSLLDRYAGQAKQSVEIIEEETTDDDTPVAIRHKFYDEKKTAEIAALLVEFDVFTEKEE